MKSIVFTRIDDRLIHGQVMTAWVQHTQANEVVIVDSDVAKDTFIQMVMKSAMPNKIELKIFNEDDAIKYLTDNGDSNSKRIFVLVKTPQVLVKLIKGGVFLNEVGVGGMGARADRTTLYRNISATEAEVDALVELQELGSSVFIQVITDDSKTSLKSVIQEREK